MKKLIGLFLILFVSCSVSQLFAQNLEYQMKTIGYHNDEVLGVFDLDNELGIRTAEEAAEAVYSRIHIGPKSAVY